MEAPPVQYTTTSDGVSIAWAEAGQGTALLLCNTVPFTHVHEQVFVNEPWYAALARSFRLITFDVRGTGMSGRDVEGVSAATLMMDAEAVVDAAKLDQFVVLAAITLPAFSTALQLATVLPERVTHLALESPFQNMRDVADTPYGRVALALAEADWTVYTQTLFRVLGGWGGGADAAWVEPVLKAVAGWVDPSVGVAYVRVQFALDLSDLFTRVRQPTLVLRNDPNIVPARLCQRVAARIPGAQFRQYTDPTYAQQVELIRAFVGERSDSETAVAPAGASGMAVILFTDIVDSTALTERMGDTVFRTAARTLDQGMRAAMRETGGVPVDGKVLGDGVMGVFTSASQAIAAARRCVELSAESELRLHVGLHAGDVIREAGNVYGGAVNIASRICALSAPGEILVSATVRDLARTSAGVTFADRGDHVLKGIDDTVRLYEVRWRE